MKVYTVHTRPDPVAGERDVVVVKEGFSWPAFLFGPLWALLNGLWLATLLIVAALIVVSVAVSAAGLDALSSSAVLVAFALVVGFGGNDWRRAALARRGWTLDGLSAAPDRDSALRRYVDLHGDDAPRHAARLP